MLQNASILLLYGFIVLPILVAVALSAIIWRAVAADGDPRRQTNGLQIRLALGAVAWLAITLWASADGVLRHFERQPPPMLFLVAAVFALAGWLAFSWIGDLIVRHTSWVVLVGLQGFRLLMFRKLRRG